MFMSKKKKIIAVLALVLLIIGNIIFLCQDFCGTYKGSLPELGSYSNRKIEIYFYDNTCKINYSYFVKPYLYYGGEEEFTIQNYFYSLKDNMIILEKNHNYPYYSSEYAFRYERQSVFNIVEKDNGVSLISTRAIVIQVIFIAAYLCMGVWLIKTKIKERKIIKNEIRFKKTDD